MGNHLRFKDEEDEEMDATMTTTTMEEEEEETQNKGNDNDDDDMLDEPAHDFGPDPEFMVRKPEANLMMMFGGGAAGVTSTSNARGEDKEDKEEGTTMRRSGGASAASSFPSSSSVLQLQSKHKEKGAVYITQMESNFDFSKVCYRTSANEAKVFDVHSARGATSAVAVPLVRHERAVTDAYFPVPNELTTILSCSHDNTVREWDARTNNAKNCVAQARVPNHILGKNGSLETCSIGGANETILAVSCGEKILFYDRRMIRQGGGGGGGEIIKQFEDAHSETVTKLRFHPEKRHILQTSSVDGLTCTFNLFDEIDDENSLVSIGTANAAINDFGFLKSSGISSGSNSGSVSSKNILWALTGIEEIHLFDCDASGTTCGVEIGHVKNAREKAREAAKQAKAAMSARKVSSKPSSSSISKNGLKDMIENGVDYIINVIDGGDSNNHKYYACCGTINGTVGLFPIAYDQNGMKSDTSTQPLTLLAPEYVLPNDASVNEQQQDGGRDREDLVMKGHGDIVRCLLASSSSSSMATSDGQNMHLYTGGEDSSVCAWTATTMRGNIIDNNHNGFGGGAMRNSPSSSFRSGRESPY